MYHRFAWIGSPKKCPKTAIGFDFKGATFPHVGDRLTFEVVLHTFGPDTDDALRRIGELDALYSALRTAP